MSSNVRPPREAYTQTDWMEKELASLFSQAWGFMGMSEDFAETGDYRTARIGSSSIIALKGRDGDLSAFHNLCRHRGAQLLDDESGNTGGIITCPYHRWTYGIGGELRGMPNRAECFPDLDRKAHGLKLAAIGTIGGLVFVNPDPAADFEAWAGPLREKLWPHDLAASDLKEGSALIYDLKCNWKVFVENALDGYHLAYLHENTLGGPLPDQNDWERAGEHQVWYATEEGIRHRLPMKVREEAGSYGMVESGKTPGYGGVFHLFPATLVVPTPFGFSVSSLHPTGPDTCRINIRNWVGPWQSKDERKYIPGYNKETGIISSDNWTQHPLETGDFQTEDVWICEKVQRGLSSVAYEHGPLSVGPGAEDPLRWFHEVWYKRMETAGRAS